MAEKQLLLHELLQEDQEPFHLKSYIADRRSKLTKSSPTNTLHLKTSRNPITIHETSTSRTNNLCRHACFFSFQNSPDVTKSPFFYFPSPGKNSCKSPNTAVFLNIPSRTAAVLVEAAIRIQKQQQLKSKTQSRIVGFGLFGSFLKRLKDRSKNRRRGIGDNDLKISAQNVTKLQDKLEETVWVSCSDWTEDNEDKSFDFESSTSSCGSECSEDNINRDFALGEPRFCSSPFRFSLHRSSSSSGHRTPEFPSPAASPRRVKQETEKYESRMSDNVDDEEKEQCSPVSVLEPPFEDDGHHAEQDDYDLDCGYENVQRVKQQLLYRLRRFEKLAELDPIELERKLLEGSDDEELGEIMENSDDDEPFVTQVFNQSNDSRNMSSDMKRLVSDLFVEEKSEGNTEVVMGRICNRLDSWKQVELDTIDMMIGLDFKKEFDRWTKFHEQMQETAAEIELAVYGLLVQELSDELFDYVPNVWT